MELEKIPSIIAVTTFAALSLTVAHDWGYFGVIGGDFQSFYTSYDYVSEMLVSIGPAFIGLIVILAIQGALARASNFSPPTTPESRWGRWFTNWYLEFFQFLVVVAALLFSDETNRVAIYILAGLIWSRVAGYILSHDDLRAFRRSLAGLLLVILPGAMIAMYGVGHDAAYYDLKDPNQYRLLFKNKDFIHSVKLLRLLDKGALVLDPSSKAVEFYPSEDIARLERDAPIWDAKSFACRHGGWACNQGAASPK
jgi:hypothetical protein